MLTKKNLKRLLLAASVSTLLVTLPGFAADGDKSKIKGLITDVQGNTITVKDTNNVTQTITLSPDTKVKSTKGLTGAIQDSVEQTALMPGLPISADVVAAGTGFNATKIEFKSEDFKVAQQVRAGTETRMNEFGTYDVLASTDVLFASGSTTISAQGKSDLMAIATKAKSTKDYRMVVQGFTDSTGDAATNQRLSTMRAAAVTNFLQQKAGVSPGRVQSPDGMGIAADAGTGSNANARKVTVRLVVDKGVNAGNK